ncbi:MAG: 16S rRNA (cytosine(1402)-N(4))-methyltransferase RsmH [Candidatus Omnitrophota bacterium]
MATHESVLLNEVLEWLKPKAGEIFVDGTIGLGGHAASLLDATSPEGILIGVDKDPYAIAQARARLSPFGKRAMLIQDDYQNIAQCLRRLGFAQVQWVLLDLGVSSMQLDEGARGFSFRLDGPLDMRMNPQETFSARQVVNEASAEQLESIFRKYGQERFARSIARKIVMMRERRPLETTKELEAVIFYSVPKSYRYGRIHPATRCFQALRIAVNQELESLENFLKLGVDYLSAKARIAVISFHSLEDGIVKRAFRQMQQEGLGVALTKKPIEATEFERACNPRSRSAKLRVFEKN